MSSRTSSKCRFCSAELKHTFVDLGSTPISNNYLDASDISNGEIYYPLHAYVCHNCLLVQVGEIESPQYLFNDNYAYFSSYSDTWLEHCRNYYKYISARLDLNSRSHVVEIASNDGYLLQYFCEAGIPVVGIEPAASVADAAEKKGIPTIREFFGRDLASDMAASGKHADLIIGNNVFAHVPDINDFTAGMKILLKETGVITLEFPHLLNLIMHNQFDTIYHEHYSYFSCLTVSKILALHGLLLFDVEELPTHGGSLRIYACHDGKREVSGRVAELLEKEEHHGLTQLCTYTSFADKVGRTKRNLLERLISLKNESKVVVGYGAPAKGNTLLNYCGIGTDFIDYTVDRNPHKQGRYLPGSHIPVMHPDMIRETMPDCLLILPWNIKDEVMSQMAYIREWGGRFLVPIPEVTELA